MGPAIAPWFGGWSWTTVGTTMARTILATMVERMTVGDLAHHVGMSVEDLVELVLEPDRSPTPRRARSSRKSRAAKDTKPRRRLGRATEATTHRQAKTAKPSASKAKARDRARPGVGRGPRSPAEPTRQQIHHAIDRWLIGEALDGTGGNITHTADQLGTTRIRIRRRWAAVRKLPGSRLKQLMAKVRSSTSPPSVSKLRALGTLQAVRDAIDRWLVANALEQEGGNVTLAAERLGTSRRVVRELRGRFGLD